MGQYTWMPVRLPELYPTHLRATGAALVGLVVAPFCPEIRGVSLD